MVLSEIILLGLGFVLLVKGSDFFVKNAATIAKRFGVSEFIIGLTLVAIGTSLPELASSIAASLKGSSGLVMGNVIGSNIANIGLVVGFAAMFSVIKVKKKILARDGYIMLFVSFLLLLFALNFQISRREAFMFLLLYVVYILFLFETSKNKKKDYNFKDYFGYFLKFKYIITIKDTLLGSKEKDRLSFKRIVTFGLIQEGFVLILGLIAIIYGAKFLVSSALFFAALMKIPESFVGLSLIALGTSLPELMVSLSAARNNYSNIAVGNIIGSNIANVLLILGVSGMIIPLAIDKVMLLVMIPYMLFVSLIFLKFVGKDNNIKKREGIILLALYAIFIIMLLLGLGKGI